MPTPRKHNRPVPDPGALDLRALTDGRRATTFLDEEVLRAQARVQRFQPLTVADRLRALARLGYHPHGLYIPFEPEPNAWLSAELERVGAIGGQDERIAAYLALQAQSEQWERDGIEGAWRGQQAVVRSTARFRLLCWPRRSGKTNLAAHEGIGIALERPQSRIWVTAPTWKLVSRCWDTVADIVRGRGLRTLRFRDMPGDYLIVLENGSVLEGISLDDPRSAAGAAVDFTIVDEAVYLSPRAWTRQVLPPLADKRGSALILSSWEDEDEFFSQQAARAELDDSGRWAVFPLATWENFFVFPKGREDEAIAAMEGEMTPQDFLEQFGGVKKADQYRIYPEYQDPVHFVECAPQADHPWMLTIDPSNGSAPYGVLALQDFPDATFVHEEYHVTGALAEDAIAWANALPFRARITTAVIDCASPVEIERWARAGFPVLPVQNKPEPHISFPIVRRMLRDPWLFHALWQAKLAEVCREQHLDVGLYPHLPPAQQQRLDIAVEERLSPNRITPEDLACLRKCSHLFVSKRCPILNDHLLHYRYRKSQRTGQITDHAQRDDDHLPDCLRYFAWMFKRYDYDTGAARTQTYLTSPAVAQMHTLNDVDAHQSVPDVPTGEDYLAWAFTRAIRAHHPPAHPRAQSYLVRS